MILRWVAAAAIVAVLAAAVPAPSRAAGAGAGESVFRTYAVGEAPTLDPAAAADFTSASESWLTQLRLVTIDAAGRLHPMGAKSWTVTGGGLVYTFALDPRAKFHSGRPVTAADWKWSFDRIARPDTASGAAEALLGGVVGFDAVHTGAADSMAGIRVTGPASLQIALRPEGRGGFLNRLTSYQMAVLNRDEVEAGGRGWYANTDAGAGPFRLARWDRNTRFVFTAVPDYFLGAPRVRTIEMLIVPSEQTRLSMYEAGDLDETNVPLADYRRIAGDPKYAGQLKLFPRAQSLFIGLNAAVYPPFKDARVRRAVAQAIDRERIARTVFFGFYTPAYGLTPPEVPGTDPSAHALPYDPAAAKRLLAESGWAGRLPPLTMALNPAAPDYQMAAEPVAAMLKDTLGLDVRLQRQEFAAFRAALNRRTVFPSFMTGWTASFLDYSVYLDQLLDSRSGLNWANYSSPAVDALINEANGARTEADREAAYRRAELAAMNDAALVPVVFTRWALLVKPYVRGFEGAPLGLGWIDLNTVAVRR
jgi:ABC-type transport system substrate-binding protein